MGIFNIFKNIFKETEQEKQDEIKISYPEIEEFLKNEIKKIKEKQLIVIQSINSEIDLFSQEIKEKIKILEDIDIEQKEKDDKIKAIVYEGRKKYIEFLERLISNLEENKKKQDLNEILEEINSSFLRFNENSRKSYERATIHIGKEMNSIKESLKKFSNKVLDTFNENKTTISNNKKLSLIDSKIQENKEIENKILSLEREIKEIENKISLKEKDLKKNIEKLQEIKSSKKYLENIELEKSILKQEQEIKDETINIRQSIDFKSLSNFFHIFPEKMDIIKKYKDNFLSEFKEDKGKKLMNLLNESKLNKQEIEDNINSIKNKEKILEKDKANLKEDETNPLSSEIESIEETSRNLKKEVGWSENKKETLNQEKQKNIEYIKEKLKELKIQLYY